MLDEEDNTCKVGYGNVNNARLALSYNLMVPTIFEPGEKTKVEGHHFSAIDAVSKWESSGVQKGFRKLESSGDQKGFRGEVK
jgi:hypothetical protein